MKYTNKTKKKDSVVAYFNRLSPDHKKIALTLRTLIKKNVPEIHEQVKWGNPTFALRHDLFWIYSLSKKYITFGLFQGAELTKYDPQHRIEGTGKGMRHIKLYTMDDIYKPYFSRLIQKS